MFSLSRARAAGEGLLMLTAQLFSLHAHPSWAPQTEGPNSAAIFAEKSAWSADCPPSIIDIERHLGIACYLSIIMICMNAGEHESWIRNLLQVGHVHRASPKLYMINCENLHFHLCSNVKTASKKNAITLWNPLEVSQGVPWSKDSIKNKGDRDTPTLALLTRTILGLDTTHASSWEYQVYNDDWPEPAAEAVSSPLVNMAISQVSTHEFIQTVRNTFRAGIKDRTLTGKPVEPWLAVVTFYLCRPWRCLWT